MKLILSFLIFLFCTLASAQIHVFTNSSFQSEIAVMNYSDLNQISRYNKLEFGIRIPIDIQNRVDQFLFQEGLYATELNPFLEWDLDIELHYIHLKSGLKKHVDAFYYREYFENEETDDWDPIETPYPFRARIAPSEIGVWSAFMLVKVKNQPVFKSDSFEFNVVESENPGYVKVHSNNRNLVRGNELIFPIGQNFPGPDEHSIPWGGDENYIGKKLFSRNNTTKATNTREWDFFLNKVETYFKQGGKFIRIMQSPWSALIEYEKKGNYFDRLHYAWEQDKLLDLCEQYDAMILFNLMNHTPFEICSSYFAFHWDWERYWIDENGQIYYNHDEDWPLYCYNTNSKEIGGKLPHQTLADDEDLLYHQQRTRYYISRYGYSTNIYEFELLSEPFNVDVNAKYKTQPYFVPQDGATDEQIAYQKELFQSIEKYQRNISTYIKEELGHDEHLIGVDYASGIWNPDSTKWQLDKSYAFKHIDIIALNDYDVAQNRYIKSKSGSNNEFGLNENSKARMIHDLYQRSQKPIILSEQGIGDGFGACTEYAESKIDAMSMGFVGVCGFNVWEGKDWVQSFIWPSTILAQNFAQEHIVQVLNQGNGNWIQGRQVGKIKNSHKVGAKEVQYYLSEDRQQACGYVRNRTHNTHTKRMDEGCNLLKSPNPFLVDNFDDAPINELTDITWSDGPKSSTLVVEGLDKNAVYEIHFYLQFKNKLIVSYKEQTSSKGKFTIKFPKLIVQNEDYNNPIVWFTLQKVE